MAEESVGKPERPPLSPAQVAKRWGCSSTLIYDLLAAGKLRGFRLGKLWRVSADEVERYENAPPPPPEAEAETTAATPRPDAAQVTRAIRMTFSLNRSASFAATCPRPFGVPSGNSRYSPASRRSAT